MASMASVWLSLEKLFVVNLALGYIGLSSMEPFILTEGQQNIAHVLYLLRKKKRLILIQGEKKDLLKCLFGKKKKIDVG